MVRTLLDWAASLYMIVLLVRFVVERFLPQYHSTDWLAKIRDVTEPLLGAIRKAVPPFQGIDFAYLIAIVVVRIGSWLVIAIL